MTEIPEFEEALERISQFFVQQGYSAETIWVFRGDFVFSSGAYWLRTRLPTDSVSQVRNLYEHGRTLGFGVRVNAPFHVSRRACCYLHIPESAAEAQDSWSVGLVLSVAESAPEARTAAQPYWGLRRLLADAQPEAAAGYRLPSRARVSA